MPHKNNALPNDSHPLHHRRYLQLPVLDSSLHPSGTWQAKQYTKRLVSNIVKALNDMEDCLGSAHDHI
jgi:hypothetical protein